VEGIDVWGERILNAQRGGLVNLQRGGRDREIAEGDVNQDN